jgi:L-amino acid N-acyltransferase YncA
VTAVVRDAVPADAADLLAIHNEAVRTTSAIWDEDEVELADRAAWLDRRLAAGLPVLVAEDAGTVVGYASYGPWRERSGYRHTAENALYVLSSHHGRGLASLLMDALLERARHDDLHRLVAMIESGNTVSIDLHVRRGYRVVGRLPEVGRKFDRWLDLTILQLDL